MLKTTGNSFVTIPTPLQDTLENFKLKLPSQHSDVHREGAAVGEFESQILTEFLPWGDQGCFVLATTGIVELEYAALQKGFAIFDASCRGTIELKGADGLDCINRLSTQQLLEMKDGESRLAFITSRKGGVIADAVIHQLKDKILIDVDCTVVAQLVDHIKAYIVMEDVEVEDVTKSTHWLWCLGPKSVNCTIEKGESFQLPIECVGLDGIAIALATDEVLETWNSIVAQGATPIGWYALNMARVELGVPVFMIDFDAHNLPHETSLIKSRVRFDKGCYLGQEIVARMESLGAPKQRLVSLQMNSDDLPIAGSQLWADETGNGTPVGVITSSAISPLQGGVPAVIAMVGKKFKAKDTMYVYVGSDLIPATIRELVMITGNDD
jgi:folate-binding protein YgfZ